MPLFRKKTEVLDPSTEFCRYILRSGLLDPPLLEHLASIIKVSGPSGVMLRAKWPIDRRIAVHSSCVELLDKWGSAPKTLSSESVSSRVSDLQHAVRKLVEDNGLDKTDHPYEQVLISAASKLTYSKKKTISRADCLSVIKICLTLIIALRDTGWFNENEASFMARRTPVNSVALRIHSNSILKVVADDEIALNAGASYMLNQGNSGDGTLILTNERIVFHFDDDLKKPPMSFKIDDITSCTFAETSTVPVSKEMTLRLQSQGVEASAKFYVGNYFAVELSDFFNEIV